ncbi:MAG: hypothetical protein ACREOB_06715, partial [Thermodesulfobacteriota bacterium]
DNDIIGVFFNGQLVPPPPGLSYPIKHGDCPIPDEFRFDAPQGMVQAGPNLVAFHVLDQPPPVGPANVSFFDARILAELPIPVDNNVAGLVNMLNNPAVNLPNPEAGERTFLNFRIMVKMEDEEGNGNIAFNSLFNNQGQVISARTRDFHLVRIFPRGVELMGRIDDCFDKCKGHLDSGNAPKYSVCYYSCIIFGP